MYKKFFSLVIVFSLLLTLCGCTKTVNEKDLNIANFTEDILSIKCINSLEEMMSENYEPKFEISNDYKEGDIPYLNFDFDKKDEVNDMLKAYALGYHSSKVTTDINMSKGYEEGFFDELDMSIRPIFYKDLYLTLYFSSSNATSKHLCYLCIDLKNKKLMRNKDILNANNIVLEDNKNVICNLISNSSYSMMLNSEGIFFEVIKSIEDNNIYIGGTKYNKENFDLKKYGKVSCDDNSDYLKTSKILLSYQNDFEAYCIFNENGEAELHIIDNTMKSFEHEIIIELDNLE